MDILLLSLAGRGFVGEKKLSNEHLQKLRKRFDRDSNAGIHIADICTDHLIYEGMEQSTCKFKEVQPKAYADAIN